MSAISNVLPFPAGTSSTTGTYAGIVGQLFKTFDTTYGERIFRICKASAAIPANSALIATVTSGKKDYGAVSAVTTTTTGASSRVCGVLPIEYTGTAAVASGSYFLAQVGGNCAVIAGDTLFSALSGVESRLVTGSADTGYVRQLAAFTTASTLLGVGALGYSGQLVEIVLTAALP